MGSCCLDVGMLWKKKLALKLDTNVLGSTWPAFTGLVAVAAAPALAMWGFPKIRGTLLGVPIIRTIVFWGLYWGPLILGNYHIYFHWNIQDSVAGSSG